MKVRIRGVSILGVSLLLGVELMMSPARAGQDLWRFEIDNRLGQGLLGAHVAKGPWSVHYTFYYTPEFVDVGSGSDFSWANVSLEYRF